MNRILSATLLTGLMAVLISCDKKDDPQPEPSTPNTPTSNYVYYFKANFDGKAIEVGEKKFSLQYGNGMSSSGDGDQDTNYQVIQSSYFSHYTDNSKPEYAVGMISTFHGYWGSPDYQTRADAITTGNHPYGNDDPYIHLDGGIIEYWDSNDEYWSTTQGSGDQTGSSFNITSYKDNIDGTSVKIMEAEFNCTLYNQSGATIKVTNGKFKGRIIIY